MMRHGQEYHLVRPDRVYATSVLTSIVGYQPVRDAMSVAQNFVADRGLAGPVTLLGRRNGFFRRNGRGGFLGSPITLLGRHRNGVSLLGRAGVTLLGPIDSFIERWRNFVAGIKARIAIRKIERGMVPAGGQRVINVDTSPRPPSPGASAIATLSSWMPSWQSPGSAAARISNGAVASEAPMLPALAAGGQIAPAGAFAPTSFWQNAIGGMPPVIAARSENDALRIFYANRLPGAGY